MNLLNKIIQIIMLALVIQIISQATNNVQQNSTSNIKSQEEVQRIVAQAISTPEGDIYFKKFVRNMKTTMHIKIMEHHYLFMI